MADVKISQLPAASVLTGTELIEAVQGGTNKKATPADFKTYLDTVNGVRVGRNAVINGCCRVSQRNAATLVKDSWLFGAVDMQYGMATGTAVSAGTLAQASTSPAGTTGYALHFSGITLTGAGAVYQRHRIESMVARQFKNLSASIQVSVYHDKGSAVNYTITVRKANAADNFSAVTQIAASTPQSVASAAATVVKFENVTMGDCSNGIEIEVKADCGAVTTKNFHFTELQAEPGGVCGPFDFRLIGQEEKLVQRHQELVLPIQVRASGAAGNNVVISDIPFKVTKRAAPAIIPRGTAGTDNVIYMFGSSPQTGFTFGGNATVSALSVVATKTSHGLSDALLVCTSSGGFLVDCAL